MVRHVVLTVRQFFSALSLMKWTEKDHEFGPGKKLENFAWAYRHQMEYKCIYPLRLFSK